MDDFSSHCVANDMVCHPPSMDFIGWGLSSTPMKRKEVLLTNHAPCLRESFACTLQPSSSMTSTLSTSTQLGLWCGHSSSWLPITSPIGLVPHHPHLVDCVRISRVAPWCSVPLALWVCRSQRGGCRVPLPPFPTRNLGCNRRQCRPRSGPTDATEKDWWSEGRKKQAEKKKDRIPKELPRRTKRQDTHWRTHVNEVGYGIQSSSGHAKNQDDSKHVSVAPTVIQSVDFDAAAPTEENWAQRSTSSEGVLLGEKRRWRSQILEGHRERSEESCQGHRAKSGCIHSPSASSPEKQKDWEAHQEARNGTMAQRRSLFG